MTDTTAIFKESNGEYYLFDSTKMNDSNHGIFDLDKKVADYARVSDTTGIYEEVHTEFIILNTIKFKT